MTPPAQDGPPAFELFDTGLFGGFGPSRFRAAGETPLGRHVRARSAAKLREGVADHAPTQPGVYGMLDARGRVIYVGKAKRLRVRLLSYFREKSREHKAGKIIDHTRTLVWEECADELGALLRELELIRHFRPRFNVRGMPGPRRYLYLCVSRGPAPSLVLTRHPTGKELAAYGPFTGRGRTDDAVRRLNDHFKLRDCSQALPMRFADQPELFADPRSAQCLRYEMGTCPGPCAGLSTRHKYMTGVKAVRAFLDGRDTATLSHMLKEMRIASAQLRFEQAMAIRDKMLSLQWLADRLAFLRDARKGGAFVYPHKGPDGRTVWYVIHHGTVAAAFREPTDAASKLRAAEAMTTLFAEPADAVVERTVDSVLLVSAWFRKQPDEKAKLLTRVQAYEVCSVPAPDLGAAAAMSAELPVDLEAGG